MGCRTEPAAVHIPHVLQKLHFFQFRKFFFKNNLRDLPQKTIQFFVIIHMTYRKKNCTHLPQKKITRLDNFFVHDLHFSLMPPKASPKGPHIEAEEVTNA